MALTGCGASHTVVSDNIPAPSPTRRTSTNFGVVYHNHDYTMTSQQIKKVGKEIGAVSKSDQQGVGGWHTPPVGTKLFEIVGTPINQAIAVEINHGVYEKAIIQGWFPLSGAPSS